VGLLWKEGKSAQLGVSIRISQAGEWEW